MRGTSGCTGTAGSTSPNASSGSLARASVSPVKGAEWRTVMALTIQRTCPLSARCSSVHAPTGGGAHMHHATRRGLSMWRGSKEILRSGIAAAAAAFSFFLPLLAALPRVQIVARLSESDSSSSSQIHGSGSLDTFCKSVGRAQGAFVVNRREATQVAGRLSHQQRHWDLVVPTSFSELQSERQRILAEDNNTAGQYENITFNNDDGKFPLIYHGENYISLASRVLDGNNKECVLDGFGQWFDVSTEELFQEDFTSPCVVTYRRFPLAQMTTLATFYNMSTIGVLVSELLPRFIYPWLQNAATCDEKMAVRLASVAGILAVAEMSHGHQLYSYVITPEGNGFFLHPPPLGIPLKYERCSIHMLPMTLLIPGEELTHVALRCVKAARRKLGSVLEEQRRQWAHYKNRCRDCQPPLANALPCSTKQRLPAAKAGGDLYFAHDFEILAVVGHHLDGVDIKKDHQGAWWKDGARVDPPDLKRGQISARSLALRDAYTMCAPPGEWPRLLEWIVFPYFAAAYGDAEARERIRGAAVFAALELKRKDKNECVYVCIQPGNENLAKPPMVLEKKASGSSDTAFYRLSEGCVLLPEQYQVKGLQLIHDAAIPPAAVSALCCYHTSKVQSAVHCDLPVLEAACAALIMRRLDSPYAHVTCDCESGAPPRSEDVAGQFTVEREEGLVAAQGQWQPVAVFSEAGALHAVADSSGKFWHWESRKPLKAPPCVLPGYSALYRKQIESSELCQSTACFFA